MFFLEQGVIIRYNISKWDVMKMKKIAILSLHLGYGGVEKSIVALANLLCEKYKIEIICTYKLYEKPVFDIDERVAIKYLLPNRRPNREQFQSSVKQKRFIKTLIEGLKGVKTLRLRGKTMINYIKNSDADVIISTRDIFDRWLGEYGSSKTLKIGWEHNHYHDDMKYATNVIRSCWNLDYLVLVSKSLEKFYKKNLRKSRCRCVCIPNTIDKIPKKLSPLTDKRLISVGRLSKEKGYLDLLKIDYLLLKKHPDWHLDIIGDGEERHSLEKFIKVHHLEEAVTLHGFQNKDYIDKMLNKSAIYLMTSFTESFGIVLIEAMSHGLPCIAFSSAEGARELIDSGKNGYLIKNRNYRAYIKKVEDLMKDYETRKKIGRESRKSVKRYTGDVVLEKWLQILPKKG